MESLDRPESSTSAKQPTTKLRNALWEWFWRGRALRSAKESPTPSPLRRERLRRARLATELADRIIGPVEPLREGSSLPLALSIYREAAYWALLASDDSSGAANIREAFAASSYDFSKTCLGQEKLAMVRAALVDKTFIETAEERPDVLRREVDLCQSFVHALIESNLDQEDPVAAVIVQRWLRLGVVLLVLAGALFGGKVGVQHAIKGPDLALGKPWRASSRTFECHPKQEECGGAATAIFFHTNDENRPWVEIDLGAALSFGRIGVVNREDCCPERAVPLIVEISDDRNRWIEVARRSESFQDWEATFRTVKARYVRFRVDRVSTLHLVRVSVWAR